MIFHLTLFPPAPPLPPPSQDFDIVYVDADDATCLRPVAASVPFPLAPAFVDADGATCADLDPELTVEELHENGQVIAEMLNDFHEL